MKPHCLLLVVLLSLAGSVRAEEPKVTAEEWQYLQRIGLIVKVGETVWEVFEESKGWNRGLSEDARDLTRVNLSILKGTLPPVPELQELHWQMIEGLEMSARFYDEAAHSNFGRAQEIGEEIKRKMVEVQAAWKSLEGRYPEGADADDSK